MDYTKIKVNRNLGEFLARKYHKVTVDANNHDGFLTLNVPKTNYIKTTLDNMTYKAETSNGGSASNVLKFSGITKLTVNSHLSADYTRDMDFAGAGTAMNTTNVILCSDPDAIFEVLLHANPKNGTPYNLSEVDKSDVTLEINGTEVTITDNENPLRIWVRAKEGKVFNDYGAIVSEEEMNMGEELPLGALLMPASQSYTFFINGEGDATCKFKLHTTVPEGVDAEVQSMPSCIYGGNVSGDPECWIPFVKSNLQSEYTQYEGWFINPIMDKVGQLLDDEDDAAGADSEYIRFNNDGITTHAFGNSANNVIYTDTDGLPTIDLYAYFNNRQDGEPGYCFVCS